MKEKVELLCSEIKESISKAKTVNENKTRGICFEMNKISENLK